VMSHVIRRWHWGKIAMLWAWGGGAVVLLLGGFLSSPANDAPLFATLAFLGSLALLICLSWITWVWLGGKEEA
jgi:hypothetical protein